MHNCIVVIKVLLYKKLWVIRVAVYIFVLCSISPVGEVPSTPPAEPLYKLHTPAEGEMFYFAVSR